MKEEARDNGKKIKVLQTTKTDNHLIKKREDSLFGEWSE